MTREAILQTLQNELVRTEVVIGSDLDSSNGEYFGMGISNRYCLTEHLPFDGLGMILIAELVKRDLDLKNSVIIIADELAKINGFNEVDIDKISKSRKDLLERTLDRLGFVGWEVKLNSELAKDPTYRDILSRITIGNPYERNQLAFMELYRRLEKGIKIGWKHGHMDFHACNCLIKCANPKRCKHGHMDFDERYFDGLYRSVFGDTTTFIYTEAGKALDGTPMPPYLNSQNRPRLFLRKGEDLDKVDQMPGRVRAYFNQIVDLYEILLYGSTKTNDSQNSPWNLKRRLKGVYDTIFGSHS